MIIGKQAKYYVLDISSRNPTTLATWPDVPGVAWISGKSTPPWILEEMNKQLPLKMSIDGDYPGEMLAYYYANYEVMRDDLIETLQESGAANLELYPAVIHNPLDRQEYTNYKAVNIVGLVDCAKKPPSETVDALKMDFGGGPAMEVYDHLHIDETKADAAGLLIFRLESSPNAIIVHDKIRQAIESKKIPNMIFYGPGEWAG